MRELQLCAPVSHELKAKRETGGREKKIWKKGTSDTLEDWFAVGEYKKIPNEVGGQEITAPDKVANEMRKLLKKTTLAKSWTCTICWLFTMNLKKSTHSKTAPAE